MCDVCCSMLCVVVFVCRFVVCFALGVLRYLLFVVCCVLFVACCLLFVVFSVLIVVVVCCRFVSSLSDVCLSLCVIC